MHDVSVRRATLDDAGVLASLAGELGYPSTEAQMRTRLTRVLASAFDVVFVAVIDDEIGGWIHVTDSISVENDAHAEIRGLVVHEPQRSRGIGAILVNAAEQWARERGLTRMRVRSNVTRERTHRFYERLGYLTKKTSKSFDKRLQ